MRAAAFLLPLLTVQGVSVRQAALPQAAPGQIRQEVTVKENPFAGRWTANMSKSKLDPKYQFQSATLEITVAGDTVTMASGLVNPSGQEQRAAETFPADGTETPGTLTPGVILVARWVGSHVLATIAKKDGRVIALVTYQVSDDGRTLTTRTSGMFENVIVFDRN
jgi:hypothetical protein